MMTAPGMTGVWGPILLAVGWLVVAWLVKHVGYKVKKGLEWWGAGIASLMFWGAFSVLYTILSNFSWAVYINYIGLYIGGFLAWIFGIIGSIYIMYELLK